MNRLFLALSVVVFSSVASMSATVSGIPSQVTIIACAPIPTTFPATGTAKINYKGDYVCRFLVGGKLVAFILDDSQGAVSMYEIIKNAKAANKSITVVEESQTVYKLMYLNALGGIYSVAALLESIQ